MTDKAVQSFFKSFAETEEQLDFRMASEGLGEKLPVISTGSLILDDALSCGGLPKGRLIQYYGRAGSSKTLMSMVAIRHAQQLDPDANQLFIDAEGTFSPDWAETLGCDLSRIVVVDGDTAVNGRKLFEMLLGVPKEDAKHVLVGKKTEGFLDKVASGELNFNFCVLDSIGAIIPPGEDTSPVGKMNISLLARFLTTTLKKLSLEVKKAGLVMVMINHTKDNMDPYGADHTFSGGNAYNHFLSANVFFEAVQRKDAMILDEKENKIGGVIRAAVEKSKFGPWPRKVEFKVKFVEGVTDRHEEIAQLALDYNIVTKSSNVSHEYGDKKWVGFPKFCEAINSDPELANELIQKIEEARDAKRAKRTSSQILVNKNESSDKVKKKNQKDKES